MTLTKCVGDEIQVFLFGCAAYRTEDPNKPPIWLVKMRKNQELKLKAMARKGIGKDHAKWMPVATVSMSPIPDIRINHARMATLTHEQKQEFVDSCPQKVFKLSPAANGHTV